MLPSVGMTKQTHYEVAVAGHICLDIIPEFHKEAAVLPGRLMKVGKALTALGGAVANTGLALQRLGFSPCLIGKVGDDPFGHSIVRALEDIDPDLAAGMVVAAGADSSYTLVVSPPETDRCFWHFEGTNSHFGENDVNIQKLKNVRLFHLGYPTLMEQLYKNGGEELERLVRKVKEAGLTVSLDLAEIDPDSPAAGEYWPYIFRRVLPHVDIFLPSLEEWFVLAQPSLFRQWKAQCPEGDLPAFASPDLLHNLAGEMLDMGVAVAGVKLGSQGLYIRTSDKMDRIAAMGRGGPGQTADWAGREWLVPCFQVEVKGATGAGDCTYAGFLGGLLKGLSLEESLLRAAAAGACNVEASDALSGIPSWSVLEHRLAGGWKQRPVSGAFHQWVRDEASGLYKRGEEV